MRNRWDVARHDLRRTFAELRTLRQAPLEQIQLALGQPYYPVPQRYLGSGVFPPGSAAAFPRSRPPNGEVRIRRRVNRVQGKRMSPITAQNYAWIWGKHIARVDVSCRVLLLQNETRGLLVGTDTHDITNKRKSGAFRRIAMDQLAGLEAPQIEHHGCYHLQATTLAAGRGSF